MSKPGRNDPCPCGSGKKYKQCHMAADESSKHATYTPTGKRKFKASVLSVSDKSQSIFQSTERGPTMPEPGSNLDSLKFKMGKGDFKKSEEGEALPFNIQSHEETEFVKPEERKAQPLPEKFETSKEDFEKKKENP